MVHNCKPLTGKWLANTPTCRVGAYGRQSMLTSSGANWRYRVAIRRSASALRGVNWFQTPQMFSQAL
jgi:hypothetical protein